MRVGTKSVLFGVHCFFIHPVIVAIAWIKLYGFPFDLRIWIAFFVHDLGYIGKPNMDGKEGKTHVELGTKIMSIFGQKWSDFSRYHSRFYAKKEQAQYSKLCVADKYAICLDPFLFYIIRATLSGEIKEYTQNWNGTMKEWFESLTSYIKSWVFVHTDLKPDTWTTSNEIVITKDKNINKIIGRNFIYHLKTECFGASIFIMKKDGKAFSRIYWYDDDSTTVYLDWLSVDDEVRNRGIGTELQKIREEIGIKLGAIYSRLLVEKNKWMHEWYKRRGYVDYKDYDKDWVWMQKSLI